MQVSTVSYLASPRILKLYEGEWRPSPVLEVDEDDLAVLVEQVVHVLGTDVRRQVANVDASLAHAGLLRKIRCSHRKCLWPGCQ